MSEQKRLAIGAVAPNFNLPGVDKKQYSLESFKEKSIVVIIFSCNHCPYVKAYEDRMIALQSKFQDQGVALVAINANETELHPEDTFENMIIRARDKQFNFPYLRDEDQKVAEAYGAHYTPEVFLLDQNRQLKYTGRIDDNWQQPNAVKTHDLEEAIQATLSKKPIAHTETQAVGCTIKWAK